MILVSSLIIAAALDVSEPVPAVVGMAMKGFILSGLLILFIAIDLPKLFSFQKDPPSVKSQRGLFKDACNKIDFPTSRLLPPPNATIPSWFPFLNFSTPFCTWLPRGFPFKSEKISVGKEFFLFTSIAFKTMFVFAKSLSVTNNGFFIFNILQALGKSAILPLPNQTVFGYPQFSKESFFSPITNLF